MALSLRPSLWPFLEDDDISVANMTASLRFFLDEDIAFSFSETFSDEDDDISLASEI